MDSTTTSHQCNILNHYTGSLSGTFSIEKAAKEHGVDLRWALYCRIQYIRSLLKDLEAEVEELLCDDGNNEPVHLAIMNNIARGKLDEMIELTKQMKACERRVKDIDRKQDGITDEQIAIARAYPIEKLVKFHKGKAIAPCHDDRNPSMFHGTRKNLAVCPVCDKKWGPIDWLMEIEGKTFVEAVKELAH